MRVERKEEGGWGVGTRRQYELERGEVIVGLIINKARRVYIMMISVDVYTSKRPKRKGLGMGGLEGEKGT